MACTGMVEQDILFDCENASIAGLETTVNIYNTPDIDRAAITFDPNNPCLMTGFGLLPGKTGFCIQGVKQVNSTAWELVKKDTGADKKKHTFNGFILNMSAENKCQLEAMSQGGSFVISVEKKYKGADNAEAFDVYGIESGLELNVATYNSNENDGSAVIELSSVDGFEESKIPATLLIGDYAATKTLHDNKFINP